MPRVGLRAYNPVEIGPINGHLYETVDPPDSKTERLTELWKGLEGLNEQSPDEDARNLIYEWFDLLTTPIEGGKQKLSTVLRAGLKAGTITPAQLALLWVDTVQGIGKANNAPEGEDPTRPT